MVIAAAVPDFLKGMPVSAASTVKTAGWKGIVKVLAAQGRLLITNHNEPQAVILTTAEYSRLLEASQAANGLDPIAELRRRFDERLSALNSDDAGDRMRAFMATPTKLNGNVKAGSTY